MQFILLFIFLFACEPYYFLENSYVFLRAFAQRRVDLGFSVAEIRTDNVGTLQHAGVLSLEKYLLWWSVWRGADIFKCLFILKLSCNAFYFISNFFISMWALLFSGKFLPFPPRFCSEKSLRRVKLRNIIFMMIRLKRSWQQPRFWPSWRKPGSTRNIRLSSSNQKWK